MSPSARHKDRSCTPVPPPVVYGTGLAVGLLLDYRWPVPILPEPVQYALGFTVIAASLLLFGLVLREFARAGTSIDHRKPTTTIITSGPFALSRNPVYVSMTMLMVGIAVAADSLWVLAAAVPAVWIVHWFVIRLEEENLQRLFGDEYDRYKARVRRWI